MQLLKTITPAPLGWRSHTPTNKCVADKNDTTTQQPTVFGSKKLFSFYFLQTIQAVRVSPEDLRKKTELKK